MAWYSDEQWEMIKDSREKKSIAASAFKQKTHCGKGGAVKFPSDYLSKKELKAMSGECVSYRLGSPISWQEFKTWPEEHQKNYVKLLRNKYDIPDIKLAEAMGADKVVFGKFIRCLGLGQGRGAAAKGRWWDGTEFYKWWNGIKEEKHEEETPIQMTLAEAVGGERAEEIENVIEEIMEEVCPGVFVDVNNPNREQQTGTNEYHRLPVIPKNGTMTFENNNADDALATMKSLLSNVKCNLTISWECAGNE